MVLRELDSCFGKLPLLSCKLMKEDTIMVCLLQILVQCVMLKWKVTSILSATVNQLSMLGR